MDEEKLIEVIDSIIKARRNFYVGFASKIDENGNVTLNGITAKVVGTSLDADVILRDGVTGEWIAFVRGYSKITESSRLIILNKQDPRQKLILGLYWFASFYRSNDTLLIRDLQQTKEEPIIGEYPPYGEAAWLMGLSSTPVDKVEYLRLATPNKTCLKTGDVEYVSYTEGSPPDNSFLEARGSQSSLVGLARVVTSEIFKPRPMGTDPRLDTLILLKIDFGSRDSSRKGIIEEAWSIGFTKTDLKRLGITDPVISLKKSLSFDFRRREMDLYGDFYTWYWHRLQFPQRNFAKYVAGTLTSNEDPILNTLDIITEYPLSNGGEGTIGGYQYSAEVSNLSVGGSTVSLNELINSSNQAIPASTISIPDTIFQFVVTYQWGDLASSEVIYNTVDVDGLEVDPCISYRTEEVATLARKVLIYIEVYGTRYYASRTKHKESGSYRMAFFKDSPDARLLEYYVGTGDLIPRQHDPASTAPFLFTEYLAFPEVSEEKFAGDNFLWDEFKTRLSPTAPSIGYVDPSFRENGSYGKCTFIKAAADEIYSEEVPIGYELLPTEDWAYQEKLVVLFSSGNPRGEFTSPLPRLTPLTNLTIKIQLILPSHSTRRPICGIRGKCKEEFNYFGGQAEIGVWQGFCLPPGIDLFSFTGPILPTISVSSGIFGGVSNLYAPERYLFFKEKQSIQTSHEYGDVVFRRAMPYIIVDGVRRYAVRSSWLGNSVYFLAFARDLNTSGLILQVEPTTDIARIVETSGSGYVFDTDRHFPVAADNPFSTSYYYTFGEKRFPTDNFLWTDSISSTPGFATSGYIDPTFTRSGNVTLFQSFSGVESGIDYNTPATIYLDFLPDSQYSYREKVIFDPLSNSIEVESPWAVDKKYYPSYFCLRAYYLWHTVFLNEKEELGREVSSGEYNEYTGGDVSKMRIGLHSVLSSWSPTSIVFMNAKNNTGEAKLFGLLHLTPFQSESISTTGTSVSGLETVIIHGDGKITLKGLDLIPLFGGLDTRINEPPLSGEKENAGYIGYEEGFVDNLSTGDAALPCLRIKWKRAYATDPTTWEADGTYDNAFYDAKYAHFDVILIPLGDKIEVIYQYFYLADFDSGNDFSWAKTDYDSGYYENLNIETPSPETTGVFIAGTTTDNCIFKGSGTKNGIQNFPLRTFNTDKNGEFRFYIQDGEIKGYDQVNLSEDGKINTPIRTATKETPLEGIHWFVLRIEAVTPPVSGRRISLYLTDDLTPEDQIDFTNPLSSMITVQNKDILAEVNPLQNKGRILP